MLFHFEFFTNYFRVIRKKGKCGYFSIKKGKREQIFPMRAGDAKQKITLPWPHPVLVRDIILFIAAMWTYRTKEIGFVL